MHDLCSPWRDVSAISTDARDALGRGSADTETLVAWLGRILFEQKTRARGIGIYRSRPCVKHHSKPTRFLFLADGFVSRSWVRDVAYVRLPQQCVRGAGRVRKFAGGRSALDEERTALQMITKMTLATV